MSETLSGAADTKKELLPTMASSTDDAQETTVGMPIVNSFEVDKFAKTLVKPPIPTSFSDLYRFLDKKEKALAVSGSLLALFQGAVLPLGNLIVMPIIGLQIWARPSPEEAVVFNHKMMIITCIYVALTFVSITSCTLLQLLSRRVGYRLKNTLFTRLVGKKLEWMDKSDPKELTAVFCQHITNVTLAFSSKLFHLCFYYSMFVVAIIVGLTSSLHISVLLVGLVTLIIIPTFLSKKKSKFFEKQLIELRSKTGVVLAQALSSFKQVKALCAEEHELKKFSDCSAEVLKKTQESTDSIAINIFWVNIVSLFGFLLFTICGVLLEAYQVKNPFTGNTLDMKQFAAVGCYISQPLGLFTLFDPINAIFERGKHSIQEIDRVFKEDTDSEVKSGGHKEAIKGHVRFDNVSFSYPTNPNKAVLDGISFEVLPGQKLGIVGVSGCGKTTILMLLQRFYEPTSGTITIDGIDIKEYDLTHLRTNIGQLTQNPVFFSISLRDNILMGTEGVNDSEVWRILERLEMKSVCERLPKKLDTQINNGGNAFSAGQKQKLSIARSLLRNPPVLMFDEATGVLDKSEEKEVQGLITEICHGKTSLFVAHKLDTIVDADKVIVLNEGRIVEEGTYDQLIRVDKGYCQQLYELEKVDKLCEAQEESEASATQTQNGKTDAQSELASVQTIPVVPQSTVARQVGNLMVSHKISIVLTLYPIIISTLSIVQKWYVCRILVQGPMLSFCPETVKEKVMELIFADPKNQRRDMLWSMLVCVVVSVVQSIMSSKLQTSSDAICEDFMHKLRILFSRKVMFKDSAFHDRLENNSSVLSHLLMSETTQIRDFLLNGIARSVRILWELLLCGVIAARINKLVLVVLLSSLLLICLFGYLEAVIVNSMAKQNQSINVAILDESTANLRTVKSLGAESLMFRKYTEGNQREYHRIKFFPYYSAVVFAINQVLFALVCFMMCLVVRHRMLMYEADFFKCVVLVIFVFLLTTVRLSSEAILSIVSGVEGFGRLLAKMSTEARIEVDPLDGSPMTRPLVFKPKIKGKLEFRNVFFRYSGASRNAIQGISFTVPAGQSVAFFGRSGAGKTTIVELLLRLYDPTKGEILIDDIDIRNFNLTYLRSLFGTFVQNSAIFPGTLRYNVQYNTRSNEETVIRALKQARLDNFTQPNEHGLERILRANGDNVSGGQRQRINAARVFARTSQMYIFDEATSALDKTNEAEVMREVSSVSVGKTSLLLSTRATYMREVPTIYVIEKGMLIENGNYESLQLKRGFFYRFSK